MIRSHICRSGRVQVEPAQLIVQIVLQRLRPGDHVGHGVVLPLAFLFRPACWRACERSSKWSGHSSSMFISRSKSSSLFFVSSTTSSRSSTVGASGFGGLDFFFRQIGIFVLLLEQRVFLHLLLDPLLQGHDRQLQDLHRLDHARRKHLLLHHPQFLAEGKSHGRSLIDCCVRPPERGLESFKHSSPWTTGTSKLLPAGQGVGQNLLVSKF